MVLVPFPDAYGFSGGSECFLSGSQRLRSWQDGVFLFPWLDLSLSLFWSLCLSCSLSLFFLLFFFFKLGLCLKLPQFS